MSHRTWLTTALALLAIAGAAAAPILRGVQPAAAAPTPVNRSVHTPAQEPAQPVATAVDPTPAEPQADPTPAPTVDPQPPVKKARRDVDLVLAIDTSSSMDGLIDSARAQLWDIVNAVAKEQPDAHLRVGVLAYGTPSYGSDKGYVRIVTDLTDNLDQVHALTMALTTNGGEEYVGWVSQTALYQMSWSSQDGAGKILFVAGNEPADQGPVDFRAVAQEARRRGVIVDTLYAGPAQVGRDQRWAEVAMAGGGAYSSIDTVRGLVQMSTPQDQELQRLNAALNGTYLGYGRQGAQGLAAMQAADSSSSGMGWSSGSSRVATKSSGQYTNESWDTVDAVKSGRLDLAKAADDQLPAELRGLTPEQREAALQALIQERSRIQAEIRRVAGERDAYLQQNRADVDALDQVTRTMIESQL